MVERRRAVMADAEQEGLSTFEVERIKFSVTAYELAARTQLRIIKLSPRYEDSEAYEKNQPLINDARCLIDELLQPEGHSVPDGIGRKIQQMHDRFKAQIRKEGTLSSSEFATYLEDGIQTAEDD